MSLEAIGNLTFGPALPRGWTKRNGTYVREDILQISETFPKIEPGLLQYRKDNKIYYYYNFVTRTVQWQGLKQ